MPDAYERGFGLGSAITNGVLQWKQIQTERQQRKEFEASVGLYNQRVLASRQAANYEDAQQLSQYKALAKRYPDAQIESRPSGVVGEDGSAELEQVVRTPEGDIPIQQVIQMQARKQQNDNAVLMADIDALMELQARYPGNPLVKQFVAQTYSAIQAKQDIRSKEIQQQLLGLERVQAQQRLQLDQQRLTEEQRQFDAAPARQREAEKFQTDEGIRQDAARISAQKAADLEVQGAKPKEGKPPTEYDKKLGQLADRAEQALQAYDSVEYDRTSVGAGVESMLPGALRSGGRQQTEQAQLQFVNSVLRAESGATITPDEINKAVRQYFPQVGDSEQVVEQKRQARLQAVESMRGALGQESSQRPAAAAQPKSREEVRALFRAGKLGRDEARAMIRKLPRD